MILKMSCFFDFDDRVCISFSFLRTNVSNSISESICFGNLGTKICFRWKGCREGAENLPR